MSIIKTILCLSALLCTTIILSQNVGIGTATPTTKLDVAGTFRLRNTDAINTAGMYLDGTTLPTRSFIGTYDANHFGIYGDGGAGWDFLINNTTNNIGLGTIPSYRLDVNGRMRIQHDVNTAGIWFDGTTTPTRSFLGTFNNDYVGFYGNGGAGWNFVMNTTNGNVGIGTTAPTQKLDVNGTLRIRSNSPVKGSVLTSMDANGNAEWVNPIAFRAEGTNDSPYQEIPDNISTKVQFKTTGGYDLGNAYQESLSEFHVPVDGVYELTSTLAFKSNSEGGGYLLRNYIALMLERNGQIFELQFLSNNGFFQLGGFTEYPKISAEEYLLAGDKVWVEIWVESIGQAKISNSSSTFFSGNLVAKI